MHLTSACKEVEDLNQALDDTLICWINRLGLAQVQCVLLNLKRKNLRHLKLKSLKNEEDRDKVSPLTGK